MSETLNVQHIRDFVDYVEAEAMTGVYEQTHPSTPHPDFVNALKAFIGKYQVYIPVVAVPAGLPPAQLQKMRAGTSGTLSTTSRPRR